MQKHTTEVYYFCGTLVSWLGVGVSVPNLGKVAAWGESVRHFDLSCIDGNKGWKEDKELRLNGRPGFTNIIVFLTCTKSLLASIIPIMLAVSTNSGSKCLS